MTEPTIHTTIGNLPLQECLRTGQTIAEQLAQEAVETRTDENTTLRPEIASDHPPIVPEEISNTVPIATQKFHAVFPQGYEYKTGPHAEWYAYDERVEAWPHPRAPAKSDWWSILVKTFDGRAWRGPSYSCVTRTAEQAAERIAAYLTGDQNAIQDARSSLPSHVQTSRTSTTDDDSSPAPDNQQQTINTY